jgi:hypothetical protein
MNAKAVRSPVTDASSTIDADNRPKKSSAMISTLKALPLYRETDDGCLRNPRKHRIQAGEQTAGQLGDEERVENIARKSRNDHERDPLHSADLPARYRRSTLHGGCEQTSRGWDGLRCGASRKSASEIEYDDLTDSVRFFGRAGGSSFGCLSGTNSSSDTCSSK